MRDAMGPKQPTMVSGSPPYMSPEQDRGKAVDGRCDIYSLVATACFFSRRARRFRTKASPGFLKAHQSETPPALTTVDSKIPADVEVIVMRCLEKNLVDQFSTVNELRRMLSKCTCADDWTQTMAAA